MTKAIGILLHSQLSAILLLNAALGISSSHPVNARYEIIDGADSARNQAVYGLNLVPVPISVHLSLADH